MIWHVSEGFKSGIDGVIATTAVLNLVTGVLSLLAAVVSLAWVCFRFYDWWTHRKKRS